MQEIEFFEWVRKVYEHIFNTTTTTTTTTDISAKNLNRDFIGIEMDEGYFKITQEMLIAEQSSYMAHPKAHSCQY